MNDKELVLIPGFRKSGTTSLYDVLEKSGIYNITKVKEPQLLISKEVQNDISIYKKAFIKNKNKYLDASTYYIFDEAALDTAVKNFSSVKAIIMIRDPIERFYSAYNHNLNRLKNSETRTIPMIINDFKCGKEIESVIKENRDVDDKNFYRRNELAEIDFPKNGLISNFLYINEGFYSKHIAKLKEKNIETLILTFEEFTKNFDDTIAKIGNFLNEDFSQLELVKSNESRKKSKLLHFLARKAPWAKVLTPEKLKKVTRNFLEKKVQKENQICRLELVEIYKTEKEYWSEKLPQTKMLWKDEKK